MLDLKLDDLAKGFGLLHLPRMPELKGKSFPEFQKVEMDYSKIPYRLGDYIISIQFSDLSNPPWPAFRSW